MNDPKAFDAHGLSFAAAMERAQRIAAMTRPSNADTVLLLGWLYVSARRWIWAERFGTTDEIGSSHEVDGGCRFVVEAILPCGGITVAPTAQVAS